MPLCDNTLVPLTHLISYFATSTSSMTHVGLDLVHLLNVEGLVLEFLVVKNAENPENEKTGKRG